ncbi:MAG: molybdate ABC transporter substrate-binding protein [Pseudomonadota bacterium]
MHVRITPLAWSFRCLGNWIRVALVLLSLVPARIANAEAVVFAAASTRAPLDAAIEGAEQDVVVSYGASGAIARQIAQGAPADLFVSANPHWMQYLVDQAIVEAASVRVLASNRLVLIAPQTAEKVALTAPELTSRLSGDHFAVADPAVAPVGQYGREALTSLGLWSAVLPALLPTRNTLATVATVARGEAGLGLVYRSDATGVEGIVIASEIPERTHAPIHYLIAPVAQGSAPETANALIEFLTGAQGQSHFAAAGFATASEDGL